MAVLDATFLIDLQHGEEAAQAALHVLEAGPERLIVPAQAAVEYLAGMRDPVAGLADIERSFELAPFGSEHILEAAQLAEGAFEQGAFPGWADIQIAAAAVLTGLEIVTADPDGFEAISCEAWDYRSEVRSPAESEA